MIHLYPSKLTSSLHEKSLDCSCNPDEDPEYAAVYHKRMEGENPRPLLTPRDFLPIIP